MPLGPSLALVGRVADLGHDVRERWVRRYDTSSHRGKPRREVNGRNNKE